MPLHCELWGYPGAGKSTVAAELHRNFDVAVALLPGPSHARGGGADRLLWGLRCYVSWKAWLPPLTPLKRRQRALTSLCYRQRLVLDACKLDCVLEEGVLHEVWRLLYLHPDQVNKRWWRRVLRYAAPIVIVLNLPPERALERIRKKSRAGRINRELAESGREDRWRRAENAYRELLDALQRQQGIRVVLLDAMTSSTTALCSQIVALLKDARRAA